MQYRTHVSFDGDFPSDAVFDAGGDISVPPGKELAEHLAFGLRNKGCSCSDVEQHEYYAWVFDVRGHRMSVECLVQFAEPWLLQVIPHPSLIGYIAGFKEPPKVFHRKILELLNSLLQEGARFSNAKWFTPEEYESRSSPGASVPVQDT